MLLQTYLHVCTSLGVHMGMHRHVWTHMDTNKTFVEDVKCKMFNLYAAELIILWAYAVQCIC